jgi:hypothetical protein
MPEWNAAELGPRSAGVSAIEFDERRTCDVCHKQRHEVDLNPAGMGELDWWICRACAKKEGDDALADFEEWCAERDTEERERTERKP